jgi:hypothetical protein
MRRSRQPWLLAAAVVLVNWGLITHGTFAGSGDEPHYLLIAHSIAFDGDFDLANNYRDATLITAGTLQPEQHAIMRDGHLRPVHDIGMPLVFAPVVATAYRLAEGASTVMPASWLAATRLSPALIFRHQISLAMALVAAWLALELRACFLAFGSSGASATGWALLFVLSPPILAHSFLFFTEIPTAALALAVFRRVSVSGFRNATVAVFAGLATGLLFLVHARNIGIVAGLCLTVLLAWRRRTIGGGALGSFAVAVAVGLVARTAVTYSLWGSVLTTPHAALEASLTMGQTLRELAVRVTGLLFDREYGLLVYAPLYVVIIAGTIRGAMRPRDPRVLDALTIIAAYLVPVLLPQSNVHGWMGGWSPAARFLVPVVPVAAVAAYPWVARRRALVMPLVLLQIAMDAFVWQFPKTLWNDGDGVSAAPWGQLFPSWQVSGAAVSFGLFAAVTAAAAWLWTRVQPQERTW